MAVHQTNRIAAIGVLITLLTSILTVVGAAPAVAEVGNIGEATWGVHGLATGTQSDQIQSQVFAIEQIGSRVYVGGKFTEVRPRATGPGTAQPFLAAFDATTGAFLGDFRPAVNGAVYALQASPDGTRLLVGGEFTAVNGDPGARAIVALNPATGAVDGGWRTSLTNANGAKGLVNSITIDGPHVYAAGRFDRVGGLARPLHLTKKVAKLTLSNGTAEPGFVANIDGGAVWGVAAAGGRVYLAGYHDLVDGNPVGADYAVLEGASGRLIPSISNVAGNSANRDRWYGQDVVVVGDLVFWAGSEHLVRVIQASTGQVVRVHSTDQGGDYQDLEVVGNRVYGSCHCYTNHYADYDYWPGRGGPVPASVVKTSVKYVAAYSATTGEHIPSFQLNASALRSGVWAIHGDSNGCLWVGGDLSRMTVAGGGNRALGGFGKFCDDAVTPPPPSPPPPPGAISLIEAYPEALTDPGVAQVGRLYQAAFGRLPDRGGMGYWTNLLAQGYPLPDIAYLFATSDEFKARYGGDPSQIGAGPYVHQLYRNVLGREGEQGGVTYWTGLLQTQQINPAFTLFYFSESDENMQRTGTGFRAF